MDSDHNERRDTRGERARIVEALLGSEDDLRDEGYIDEFLTALGIDPSGLVIEFRSYLSDRSQKLRAQRGSVPDSVLAALTSLDSHIASQELEPDRSDAVFRELRYEPVQELGEYWTNLSVRAFAGNHNPIEFITQEARALILSFAEAGGKTSPIDPFELADYRGVAVVPRDDVRDARTVHVGGGKLQIEFNPSRPRGRVRFSVSHEIAHTLFPDCKERVRNRATHEEMRADDWQLEMLCNIGASELLMPVGSFSLLEEQSLSIDKLMDLQKQHQVSTEALLLRVGRLTLDHCFIFSASRRQRSDRYYVDYAVTSRTIKKRLLTGLALPSDSVITECTAIGYTAKRREGWGVPSGDFYIECVGIPPYPGQPYPRVMGIAKPIKPEAIPVSRITYLRGDATQPRGVGEKVIAHVVNDKTPNWGGAFARAVRNRFPEAQEDFQEWAQSHGHEFSLGNLRAVTVGSTSIVSMICQRGYGPSSKPRIRYGALRKCLDRLAEIAIERNATVHMPRVGCGQAGGSWSIVKELIDDALCGRGLKVYVYDPPNAEIKKEPQPAFNFTGEAEF